VHWEFMASLAASIDRTQMSQGNRVNTVAERPGLRLKTRQKALPLLGWTGGGGGGWGGAGGGAGGGRGGGGPRGIDPLPNSGRHDSRKEAVARSISDISSISRNASSSPCTGDAEEPVC